MGGRNGVMCGRHYSKNGWRRFVKNGGWEKHRMTAKFTNRILCGLGEIFLVLLEVWFAFCAERGTHRV